MPLSATIPLHVTPEILRNQKYAQEYVEHVALIRELLDQASLSSYYSIACDSRDLMQPEVRARVCGACSFDTRAA